MRFCPKLTTIQLDELNTLVKRSKEAGEVKKAQAILLLNRGADVGTITFLTGLKRSRIFGIRKLYLKKGVSVLKSRSKNKKELLTKKQLKEILETVKTKIPEEVDNRYLENKFWTTALLSDYIFRVYNVQYKSKTSYYLIFRKVNFTFHKPGRVYLKQNPEEIKEWVKKVKPTIERAGHDPNVVILCEDESLISTQTSVQKIWLEAGSFPKVEVSNVRKNKSIYGFLNVKTGQEHAFTAPYQTMFETAKILKRVRKIYKTELKILLLWDSAGWHKGKEAQKVIVQDGAITQIFFPRYTPELNPQEHVWNESKEKVIKNRFIPNIEKTAKDFIGYLNSKLFKYALLGLRAF